MFVLCRIHSICKILVFCHPKHGIPWFCRAFFRQKYHQYFVPPNWWYCKISVICMQNHGISRFWQEAFPFRPTLDFSECSPVGYQRTRLLHSFSVYGCISLVQLWAIWCPHYKPGLHGIEHFPSTWIHLENKLAYFTRIAFSIADTLCIFPSKLNWKILNSK